MLFMINDLETSFLTVIELQPTLIGPIMHELLSILWYTPDNVPTGNQGPEFFEHLFIQMSLYTTQPLDM